MKLAIVFAAAMLLGAGSAAGAQDAPICADRPSKATGECTVPAGRVQLETGLIDWAHDHDGGATSTFATFGSSLIKYGISRKADIELGLTPLESLHIRAAGARETATGFGDTVVRMKYKLTSDDAPVQVALDPFVKLPTASHRLGNGKVEGGLVVPMSAQLGKGGLTMSVDPEFDVLADDDGHGTHASMIQVINLGAAISDKLGVSAELWGRWNWDPAGTARQASADGAVTYLINNDVQLDAGANFGLNRRTPDVELYTGVAVRF
jgi:hypothetical protein